MGVRYILEAFEQGADGVYIVACPIGNCHHVRGNERGLARINRAKNILTAIGIEPERLDIFFLSGSQGHGFAIAAQTMYDRIMEIGPNPLKNSNGQLDPNIPDFADEGFRGRRIGSDQ